MTDEKCSCNTGATTEVNQAKVLLWIGGVVVLVTAFALWISPYFFIEDQSAIYRYMILKVPPMLMDIFVLIAAVVLFDFITPADALDCIHKDPLSTSILYSSLIIGVSLAIAFG